MCGYLIRQHLIFHIFRRPVDYFLIDRSIGHGRYRRSIKIQLLENTVHIASTVDFIKKSVEIDRRCGFILKKLVDIDRRCALILKTIGRLSMSTVEVDMDSKNREHWPHSPKLHNKRCIWLTRTLTSIHADPFQALLTKEHTRKKQTHTDKVYDGHRVQSISRRSW